MSRSQLPPPPAVARAVESGLHMPAPTTSEAESAVRTILRYLGEDPSREGLAETPKRYLKAWRELMGQDEFNMTTFKGEQFGEMIVQTGIPFYSVCEHHLLPFFGTATVAYVPGPTNRIVGLSKLARVVRSVAGRPQNQERITSGVVDRLSKELQPRGVGVSLRARHLCMEMRGVQVPGAETITTITTGEVKTDDALRREFLALCK